MEGTKDKIVRTMLRRKLRCRRSNGRAGALRERQSHARRRTQVEPSLTATFQRPRGQPPLDGVRKRFDAVTRFATTVSGEHSEAYIENAKPGRRSRHEGLITDARDYEARRTTHRKIHRKAGKQAKREGMCSRQISWTLPQRRRSMQLIRRND